MDVVIEENAYLGLKNFVKDYNKVALICDSAIYPFFEKDFLLLVDIVIPLKASEETKNFDYLPSIYQKLVDSSFDKNSTILALGGGVILDIAGFIASTYQRGIDFISLPSTLLSMCDACFGGKTGVNFNGLKNYIGTFYNPKAILINVDALNTLDNLQFSSGLAEVIKHAFIDSNFLEFIESKKLLIKEKNKDVLKEMIKRSLEIKRTIVQADFQEKNEKRALLNFGHTVGHALESLSQFKSLSHGQAVSLGMVAEAFISYKLGYLKKEIFEKLQNLLRYFDLPTLFNIDQIEELISLMKKDKKSLSSSIPLIIIHDVGYLELFQITDINLLYPILLELSKNHG